MDGAPEDLDPPEDSVNGQAGHPEDPVRAFSAHARRTPDALALEIPAGVDGERPRVLRTYGQLARAAAETAAWLELLLGAAAVDGGEPVVALHMARTDPGLLAAQLGCFSLGVPYLALEPSLPAAYLAGLVRDADVRVVVSSSARISASRRVFESTRVVPMPAAAEEPSIAGPVPLLGRAIPAERLAYVLFTSGTTGSPKGVLIQRAGVAALVADDREVFGLGPGDRVAQGSSPAYDSSVEEVWMALASGATVVVIDDVVLRSGPDLVPWLRDHNITVICPPPTLLRTMGPVDVAQELPRLRWVYVGGEALPRDVAERWGGGSRGLPGPRLVNGYGPTEATVTALRSEVTDPDDICIGTPVRDAAAHVVGPGDRELGPGEAGELLLAGPGLARGYLGHSALTNERFPHVAPFGRVYRTGDLALRGGDGELRFLGRIDAQVQVRGHRVELEAIEECLGRDPHVSGAACALVEGSGPPQLVCWVVLAPGTHTLDRAELAQSVERVLPASHVPARIVGIDALPRSTGGKVDRRLLAESGAAEHAGGASGPSAAGAGQATDDERSALGAFQRVLGLGSAPALDADLFDDLGGDSLRVALLVSELRRESRTAHVTVRDVYAARTPRAVAALFSAPQDGPDPDAAGAHEGSPLPAVAAGNASAPVRAGAFQRTLFTGAQLAWLLFEWSAALCVLGALVLPLLAWFVRSVDAGVLLAFAAPALALLRLALALPAALFVRVMRATVGPRYRPGRYPAFGVFHLRHWILGRAVQALPLDALRGTRLFGPLARATGARIGASVHVHRGVPFGAGFECVEIGAGATLFQESVLRPVELDGGTLTVGAISVGASATLAPRAAVGPGASVGARARLGPLAHVAREGHVPEGELWEHTPARHSGPAPAAPTPPDGARDAAILGLGLGITALRGLLAAGILLAGTVGFDRNEWATRALHGAASAAPGFALVGLLACGAVIVDLALLAALARVLGAQRSVAARWHAAGLVHAAGRWLSGAMLWPWWLRAAGMRIGPGAEVSSIVDTVPRDVRIGGESFLADGVYLASRGADHEGGDAFVPHATALGPDTFVGNHVVIPGGQDLPAGLLLGVCTVAGPRVARGGAWFGQPPFSLARPREAAFGRETTHDPSAIRRVNRALWEGARLALPAAQVALAFIFFSALVWDGGRPTLQGLVAGSLASAGAALGGGVLLKWLLLGRVRAGEHPLWSCWCSRWDFHYVLWSVLSRPVAARLEGTLLMSLLLRALGARVGRGVLLGDGFAQVVDPDMLHFGDGATVAGLFQAHTFEDRVLKIAPLHIGAGATLGHGALAFYGVEIGAAARIEAGGVTLKGERFKPGQNYGGAPLTPLDQRARR